MAERRSEGKLAAAGAAMALAVALALPAPATAAEHYCLATGSLNWNVSPAHSILATQDEQGFLGWTELWVDTATGDFRERTVGSAALYSDGGTYSVFSDGTGYRQHWVGQIDHGGFESLRIDLTRDPIVFMRADRMGFVETGTCVETNGRRFIDGREITQ